MKIKFSISGSRLPVDPAGAPSRFFPIENRKSKIENAFTLVEVMVVMVLLSLIVLVLMGVFSSTQAAFRASVTQTDVLEGGRATMDLIAADLKVMAPSLGNTNNASGGPVPVNFCVTNYINYPSLHQTLIGVNNPITQRTNVMENFFILSSGNKNGVPTWYGTGYAVYLSSANLYSLYRFSASRPMASTNAAASLFYTDFAGFLNSPTNYSHLIDGVVGLRVHVFDTNGSPIVSSRKNIAVNPMFFGRELIRNEFRSFFVGNALPSSVEIEMDTLEDRTLRHAESLPNNLPAPPPGDRRTIFLQGQAGLLHVFRQRVSIPNLDPSAY